MEEEFLKRLLKNSHIEFENIQQLNEYFNEIIEFFEKIKEIDTKEIRPCFHPLDYKNELEKLREDEEGECLTEEYIKSQNKNNEDKYIKGPKII